MPTDREVPGPAAMEPDRRLRRFETLEHIGMTTARRIILAVIVFVIVVAATALGYADTDRVLRKLGLGR